MPGRLPRVKGVVVELLAARRIFVPMPRVYSLDANQVSLSGVIDARRFVKRDTETLVYDDLFDRAVTTAGGTAAAIFDVSMRQIHVRQWEINEVALREQLPKRPFSFTARKGAVYTVGWSDIAASVAAADQATDRKVAQLVDMRPADVARELHDMEPERRAEVAQALADEQLADAFQELPEDEQVSLLSSLEAERAADVLEEMDPDDAADLINDLPDDFAEDLLQRMEPEEAADVRTLMQYEELTAGGMMTPEPVILAPDAIIAEALARVRNPEITPATASMVFITRPPTDTPSGRYLGAAHIQRLLREPPSVMAATVIDSTLPTLHPEDDLAKVSRFFATYNLVIAPVVNNSGQLIGAVTVDDVLDHMLPDDWRGDQMDGIDHPGVDLAEEVH
ncbi:MAG: CBS domain-containing protein [Propionibacterium sp.]